MTLWSAIAPNVIVCGFFDTANVRVTLSAAAQFASPPWLAVTLTVPSPVKRKTLPSSVAGPLTAYPTASPELAVAPNVTVSVVHWLPISPNAMLCAAFPMTSVPAALPSHIPSTTVAVTA